MTTEQEYEFAKYINEHPVNDKVFELVQQDCFNKFINASDEERKEISSLMQGLMLWRSKLNDVVNNYLNQEQNELNK